MKMQLTKQPSQRLAWFLLRLKSLKSSFNWLADLLFPINCLNCQAFGTWLCPDCFKKISLMFCQQCPKCQQLNYWGEYCDDCHQFLDGVLVVASYEQELIKKMIKTFKYQFVPGLAEPLSNLAIVFLGQVLAENGQLAHSWALPKFMERFNDNLVVPVPLSWRRRAWRGFNQSELLARRIADYYALELNCRQLKKKKHTQPQVKLNKTARQSNLSGCFTWQGQALEKRNIILIDDLVTTGSTLNECAKVLKAHGAGEVWALVLARR